MKSESGYPETYIDVDILLSVNMSIVKVTEDIIHSLCEIIIMRSTRVAY